MTYYFSLGANLGNREQTIQRALAMMEQQIGHIERCSSYYYSAPWGFESQNDFCNLCCCLATDMQPTKVLLATQAIERALGRTKKSEVSHQKSAIYSDRSIDIDIIRAFDNNGEEITFTFHLSPSNFLTLPHPLWQQRDFVRIPLAEVLHE
ncbi:MAG: 2-amino-4-hydroxy-6-hydroxymethyldihydropteridine diphosphokinase [Paludibacteraceae bacterium]|nr:2-amino-4-hydroxy-6-hydroxymethyldihydropteridine diphosphokinase [Paludibacteraceae bacterium]